MAALDLTRAARIGLIAEVLLHEVQQYSEHGQATLSPHTLTSIRRALGDPQADLWPCALALIGEAGVLDAWETEEGGLTFSVESPEGRPLPAAFAQALRQHRIDPSAARRLYDQWHGVVDLDEASFIRLCLREQEPQLLSRHWQPGPFCREGLRRRGLGDRFVADLVPEFVLLFNEQRRVVRSLDLEFFRFAAARWRRYINAFDESTDLRPLPDHWQPSEAVLKELAIRGIAAETIELKLPQFRLHARERGHLSRHWGVEFVRYCGEHLTRSITENERVAISAKPTLKEIERCDSQKN